MFLQSHLSFAEINLTASSEWANSGGSWVVVRLTEGSCYWLRGGQTEQLNRGDLLIISPRNEGLLRISQISNARMHVLNWQPDMLNGVLTLAEIHYLTGINPQGKESCRIIRSATEAAIKCESLFTGNGETLNLVQRAKLLQLVGEIFQDDFGRHCVPVHRTISASERFKQLVSQLTEKEIANLSPAELASRCGCSIRHFTRLFYKEFKVSVRTKQTRLRLQKASQLLLASDSKIIDVAMESGYRNLGLFNKMFKRYMGTTPTQWRAAQARQKKTSAKPSRFLSVLLFLFVLCGSAIGQVAKTNEVRTFSVREYVVEGNTVLSQDVLKKVFADYVGEKVTFDAIRKALSELQLAYRGRGFVTVKVSLPQQQLTNGVVRVAVTQGKLADIAIVNNRYFSSNNIMRALPGLRTNILLNSLVFSQDLDRANANRDRQIYPEIAPGPEPGTSALRLKVKDRLPLHGRVEFNNQAPPGTPDLRLNNSIQYNNLWQQEHQVGAQYMFSPGSFKGGGDPLNEYFFDKPQIASYSGFYRMPLELADAADNGEQYANLTSNDFGYDEATHKFRPPPLSGNKPELVMYASRSTSETGTNLQSQTLTPSRIDPGGTLQVSDRLVSDTFSITENLGFRFTHPIEPFLKVESAVSFGLDYKSYQSAILQTRTIQATLFIPESGSNGPPFITNSAQPTVTVRDVNNLVYYTPLYIGWDGARRDKYGYTSFSLSDVASFSGLSSSPLSFAEVAANAKASGSFNIVNAGIVREQNLKGDWSVLFKANGQWANKPLIGNEQFALGGLSGPRGYREGETYGDSAWRVQLEPRTPMTDIGMVDGNLPMNVRASAFMDYGERYSYGKRTANANGVAVPTPDERESLWGVGAGFNGTIGEHVEFRFAMAFPLLSTEQITAGSPRFYFGIAAQF